MSEEKASQLSESKEEAAKLREEIESKSSEVNRLTASLSETEQVSQLGSLRDT